MAGYVRSAGALGHIEHGRAMAIVMLTFGSAALTAALSRVSTWMARVITAATVMTSVILTEVPTLARFLHLAPLHADDWAQAVAGALVVGAIPFVFGRAGANVGRARHM